MWMALIAMTILGGLSYTRLPADLNPKVDIPTLTVTTIYPGAGPMEVESLVTRPIEEAIGTVAGARDVYSVSQESVSIVSVDFEIGTNLDAALASAREKMDFVRLELPPDALAPLVAKLDINAQPVLYLGLSHGGSGALLRHTVDTAVKPVLARVPGVAAVTVTGGDRREVRVEADPRKLALVGVTLSDIVTSLKAANLDIPAGALADGPRSVGVRTLGAFRGLADIESAALIAPQLMMPNLAQFARLLPRQDPSAPLTVGDVCRVYEADAPHTTLTRVNGRDSVGVLVTKTSDANTVTVVQDVKAALARLKASILRDTDVQTLKDQSVAVESALEDVNVSLVLGAILAMSVVYVFLRNARGTAIVALAIPACILATFIVMYFAGFTLNQMTLLALSLSVGILVDDSIVVLESITRHLHLGEDAAEAAYNGRTEIGFASITLTLADVVVFFPIAFMGGIIGAFFKQFGLTIIAATLFSLLVSFTITPSLASSWYRSTRPEDLAERRLPWLEALERFYRRTLDYALARRGWVLAYALVLLVSVVLVSLPSLGFELLPALDQGQITVMIERPADSSLSATDAVARQIEQTVRTVPDVRTVACTVGEILAGFGTIPQRGPQFAQLNIRLREKAGVLERLLNLGRVPAGLRERSDSAVADEIRAKVAGVAGARVTVSTIRTIANVGAPVQIQLRGQDLGALARTSARLRDEMAQMPGIVDPDTSYRAGRPEVQVHVSRVLAASLGVAPAQAGQALREALEGNTDVKFRAAGEEMPIRVQVARGDRNEVRDLLELPVGFKDGRGVLLGDLARLEQGTGPASIERVNGMRMVTVTAHLSPGYPAGTADSAIKARIGQMGLEGVEIASGGEAQALEENLPYLGLALGLAVVFVYLVMASLFNSLLNPFLIMFTLPMALAGALGGLALAGDTLSLVSMIGVIMLTGLMGRNAILLVDYTSTLRARGADRTTAVIEGAVTRLRPILMTTLATIFGMLPIALRIGRAAELRAPMAIVVISGLVVSTVLTLVVIPVLYTVFDDLKIRAGVRRRREPNSAH